MTYSPPSSGAIRRILKIQLGTKPVTRKDMEDLRTILIELQSKLYSLVERIPSTKSMEPTRPLSTSSELTVSERFIYGHSSPQSDFSDSASCTKQDQSGVGPGCLEQYHSPVLIAFHKWARILLSLFIDKVIYRT